MSRFWISWKEGGEVRDAPEYPEHFWVTGQNYNDGYQIICAVVDAEDEESAKVQIEDNRNWQVVGWCFVNKVASDYMPPVDRFPILPEYKFHHS